LAASKQIATKQIVGLPGRRNEKTEFPPCIFNCTKSWWGKGRRAAAWGPKAQMGWVLAEGQRALPLQLWVWECCFGHWTKGGTVNGLYTVFISLKFEITSLKQNN